MDFEASDKAIATCNRMWAFMRERIFPAEQQYATWRANHDPHEIPPIIEELRAEARAQGL